MIDGLGPLGEHDGRLSTVVEAAAAFEDPPVLYDEACFEWARALDTLLVAVARGRAALDLAIGERLEALSVGDRALALGYSGIGDYAREQLGIAASTAQKMARFARRLRDCPALGAAVRCGEVSIRQAEAVLPVARGNDAERWVERARQGETVRSLQAAARESGGADSALPSALDDEPFARLWVEVPREKRPVVEQALKTAGALIGGRAPKWERLEALCAEYLASHAAEVEPEGDGRAGAQAAPLEDCTEAAREWLERETACWVGLSRLGPVAAPDGRPEAHCAPRVLHEELLRLAEMRSRWDEVFGHVAMLFLRLRAWQTLEFASFDHYAEERLGMSGRAVEQRAALERRLFALPSLRRALGERRISYEQARLIARHADDRTADGWIERATRLTCVALRDELQGEEERQMCARGTLAVVAPLRLRPLIRQAFDAARRDAGEWLEAGECLVRIARHFLDVWEDALKQRNTLRRRVLERDGGRCQVPGCSRAPVHAHHVTYRSAGGGDEPENLVALCAAHHLRGIHAGRVRVRGKAPHGLRWELGVCPGREPIATFEPDAASVERYFCAASPRLVTPGPDGSGDTTLSELR